MVFGVATTQNNMEGDGFAEHIHKSPPLSGPKCKSVCPVALENVILGHILPSFYPTFFADTDALLIPFGRRGTGIAPHFVTEK